MMPVYCGHLYWSMADLPKVTLWNKTDSPPHRSYRLTITPPQRGGFPVHLPYCDFLSGLSLHRSYTCCHTHCELIHTTALLSPGTHPLPLPLRLFLPPVPHWAVLPHFTTQFNCLYICKDMTISFISLLFNSQTTMFIYSSVQLLPPTQ